MNLNTLSPYVRRAWHCTLKAGKRIRSRILVDYEIILVTDGSARLSVEGREYEVGRGEVIFIPPGVEHEICVGEEDFVQPHIHFDPIYTEDSERRRVSYRCAEDLSPEQLSLLQADVLGEYSIPFLFRPADPKRFQRYLFEIIEAYESKRPLFTLRAKSRLLMLLGLIIDQFGGRVAEARDNSPEMIRDYIDNNFEESISLDSLAEQFGLNRFTMLRRFKEAYGRTVIGYYNDKRTEYARGLLLDGDLSITEIGARLSFSDLYSFSRFFKMHTGYSPRRYRELFRKD